MEDYYWMRGFLCFSTQKTGSTRPTTYSRGSVDLYKYKDEKDVKERKKERSDWHENERSLISDQGQLDFVSRADTVGRSVPPPVWRRPRD